MENLRIDRSGYTLVDQVEEKLIQYFKDKGFRPGSSIPNENELAASLGIGRTVLREALSRFKMTGMIQSRTKRGMTLAEPSLLASLQRSMNPLLMSDATLRNLFEMSIVIEIGTAGFVFDKLTPEDSAHLEKIVERQEKIGDHYDLEFHIALYNRLGNHMISEFQTLIIPVIQNIINDNRPAFDAKRKELISNGKFVSHRHLLDLIKAGDKRGYCEAIKHHFDEFEDYFTCKKIDAESLIRQIVEEAL